LEAIEMAGRDMDQPDEELIERLIEKNMSQ